MLTQRYRIAYSYPVSLSKNTSSQVTRTGVLALKGTKKQDSHQTVLHMLALPIFPGRLQPSIVGRSELNFRVRNGNGWTLALINTDFLVTRTGIEPMFAA